MELWNRKQWGSAKPSNIKRIQSPQSIILRNITNCPFYNLTLPNDLNIPFVRDLAIEAYNKFHSKLLFHPNPVAHDLLALNLPGNPRRRLKRVWPRDLLS